MEIVSSSTKAIVVLLLPDGIAEGFDGFLDLQYCEIQLALLLIGLCDDDGHPRG